ncbi:serine/threonine protein kinase [Ktedonosporobacter rubrisoli]|uniref:non-specific serine/threonine protein kinase n=1 Tax=Ktedonosporobacter rubrisoli TaxID=2509675 RepID=A0A4P6JUE6_KTERU|nr:serine/threonine-protein kinase [Ktedonosporobacter rubrisoli]QBD79268.1 serine/threonine protein kinase [Ktedonosporobacter rubrisoli]
MSKEPRRLGKYELRERLARGGQGEVWKALDTQLRRHVAIKLLHADLQHDTDFVERFEREAQLIAALRHPNIVQIHDFRIAQPPEAESTVAYMVMDFVSRETLADHIRNTSRKGQFPPATDIVHLFTGVSLALDYAHGQGMIHRDIKPANILLDHRLPTASPLGEPVLTDFGIARLQGSVTGTMAGSLLGTPLYISPEQAKGLRGDHRSDLYSLGIILYEIATGITPFRGDTTMAILMQHVHTMPTPPPLINPRISSELSAVILKSIAKSPDDRFPDARSLTIALAEAVQVPVPAKLKQPRSSPRSVSSTSLASQPLTPPYGNTRGLEAESPPYPQATQRNLTTPASSYTPGSASAIYMSGPQARVTQQTPPLSASPTIPAQSSADAQSPQSSQVTMLPARRKRFIVLAALLTVVLLGGLIATFSMLFPATPAPAPTVGRIQFSNSGQVPQGTYDQLQIDLPHIPAPSAGHVYYAWIDSSSIESDRPHWKLNVDAQGHLYAANLTYRGHPNLLIPNSILLITEEDASMEPVVPFTDPRARLYYAQIKQSGTSGYDVQACPPEGTICQQ